MSFGHSANTMPSSIMTIVEFVMGSGKVICTMAEDAKIPVEAVHVVSAAFSWMDRRGVEHGVQS